MHKLTPNLVHKLAPNLPKLARTHTSLIRECVQCVQFVQSVRGRQ